MVVIFFIINSLHIPLALSTNESQMQTGVLQIQTHIISGA